MQTVYLKSGPDTERGTTSTSVFCITEKKLVTVTTHADSEGAIVSAHISSSNIDAGGSDMDALVCIRSIYGDVPTTVDEYQSIRQIALGMIE